MRTVYYVWRYSDGRYGRTDWQYCTTHPVDDLHLASLYPTEDAAEYVRPHDATLYEVRIELKEIK